MSTDRIRSWLKAGPDTKSKVLYTFVRYLLAENETLRGFVIAVVGEDRDAPRESAGR